MIGSFDCAVWHIGKVLLSLLSMTEQWEIPKWSKESTQISQTRVDANSVCKQRNTLPWAAPLHAPESLPMFLKAPRVELNKVLISKYEVIDDNALFP